MKRSTDKLLLKSVLSLLPAKVMIKNRNTMIKQSTSSEADTHAFGELRTLLDDLPCFLSCTGPFLTPRCAKCCFLAPLSGLALLTGPFRTGLEWGKYPSRLLFTR